MGIESFTVNEFVEIVDVGLIKQGSMLWNDGDIVQVKGVDVHENRIEVWSADRFLSELIYGYELEGIAKIDKKQSI